MDEIPRAAMTVGAMLADHLAGVPQGSVWQPVPVSDRGWLTGQALPETGRDLDALLVDIRDKVMPYPMGNGHPRFFGWVNSPPAAAGVIVEPLAAVLNPPIFREFLVPAIVVLVVTSFLSPRHVRRAAFATRMPLRRVPP